MATSYQLALKNPYSLEAVRRTVQLSRLLALKALGRPAKFVHGFAESLPYLSHAARIIQARARTARNRSLARQAIRTMRRARSVTGWKRGGGTGRKRKVPSNWAAKARVRRKIGERPGTSNSKTIINETPNGWVSKNSYTFNTHELTNIGAQGTTNSRNTRNSNTIKLSGWKICFNFRNNVETPILCNFAIIAPKEPAVSLSNEFFRRPGAADRGVNFIDSTHTGLTQHCYPINTDRFRILRHWRFTLAGNLDSSAPVGIPYSSAKASYRRFEFYLKLNRQLRFENEAATYPIDERIWIVHWANKMGEPAMMTTNVGMYATDDLICTYFRDVNT